MCCVVYPRKQGIGGSGPRGMASSACPFVCFGLNVYILSVILIYDLGGIDLFAAGFWNVNQ